MPNILNNASPIHYQVQRDSKELENSRVCMYKFIKITEGVNETYDGEKFVYQITFFSTMSAILISSPTGCIVVFQFQHGTNHEAHREINCCTWSV